ncbi:MAG: helix-turn-helix transcriptional regulator [Pyrinomonadaceae bacterium]
MSTPITAKVQQTSEVPVSTPFGLLREPTKGWQKLALLALSHTVVEHRIYRVMQAETALSEERAGIFGVRRLLALTGMRSYSSVRRGCDGLIEKLSIEHLDESGVQRPTLYRVFSPSEIFQRRRAAGVAPYPKEVCGFEHNKAFNLAIGHVIGRDDMSRREALVTLCCVEGLSNGEIAARLQISEQTVKAHLRYVFDKFSVRRRTELVSHLLTAKFKGNGHKY